MNHTTYRVADLAEQIRGVSYGKQDASKEYLPGYVPILRAGNITDDGITLEDLVYVPATKVSPKQKLRQDDILIAASSGSLDVVGKAARVVSDFNGGFGAFCKVLRPRKNVNPAYFSHYFKTSLYRSLISSLAAGANINNLRNSDLDNLEIPLPPLSEQKRIAAILDAADAMRSKRREAIALLDTLLQSTFLDMFGDPVTNPMGWNLERLSKVCEISMGQAPKGETYNTKGIGYPLIAGAGDFGAQIPSPKKYTTSPTKLSQPGDLILCIRATIGDRNWSDKVYCLGRGVAGLRAMHDIINQEYLALWFDGVKHVLVERGRGATFLQVSKEDIATLQISLPPIYLQRRFASIVEIVENQKTLQRAHLAELDTLFASLQQRAFKGEL